MRIISKIQSIIFVAAFAFQLSASALVSGQSTLDSEAQKSAYTLIVGMFEAGQIDAALAEASKKLAANPAWNDIYLVRAKIYSHKKQFVTAIADYTKYISLTPASESTLGELAQVHLWRGENQILNGNHDTGIADFAKAVEYGGDFFVEVLNKHTREHLNTMDAATAISDFTKVIAAVPLKRSAKLYFNRGRLNYNYKFYDAAIVDYTKWMELEPDNIQAPFQLGRLYTTKENHAAAITAYTRAIQIAERKKPNGNLGLYTLRAEAYVKVGNVDAAIADYSSFIKGDPSDTTGYMHRGNLYAQKEQFNAAIADFTFVIDTVSKVSTLGASDPWLTGPYGRRGFAYGSMGKTDNALADLNKSIELNPKNAEAYYGRSIVLCRANKKDLAKQDEAKVIALTPGFKFEQPCGTAPISTTTPAEKKVAVSTVEKKSPASTTLPVEKKPTIPTTAKGWFDKGVQHLDDRDLTDAVVAFTKAIALKTGYSEAFARRAVAHFAGMGHTAAQADINMAIKLDATNYEYYLIRASFHCFREEKQLAKRDEAKVIQLGGTVSEPCK